AHPGAAEAAVIGLLEMKAGLERHALERRANCLASDPERPCRQRYRVCQFVAAVLDGAEDRAVTIDAAGAARAIVTTKREKLAGDEAPRGVGGEAFRAGRAGCQQDQNYHRQPLNHTELPLPPAAATCCSASSAAIATRACPAIATFRLRKGRQLKESLISDRPRLRYPAPQLPPYSDGRVKCSMRAVQ